MTYAEIILYLVPDAVFGITGNDYDTLEWHGPGDAPAEQDIIDAEDAAELACAKARKTTEMQTACQSAIYAGFTSDALGTNHHYPLLQTDQTNLAAVIIESLLTIDSDPDKQFPFWCTDGETWARRVHTHTEIRAVGMDAAPFVRGHQDHLRDLRNTINDATTVAEVDAVTW